MSKLIDSYPSIVVVGHNMVENIFSSDVLIEEKVDGSQVSFANLDGELVFRSKDKNQFIEAPDNMFIRAVEVIKTLDLHPNWVYRGEYLLKPKHNTLTYSRVPKNNIVIFDIQTGIEKYLSSSDKKEEAERIGLECVPVLYEGFVSDVKFLDTLLDKESFLGGTKIEGIVIKNYSIFTAQKKVAMAKYVSQDFVEVHGVDWKKRNPSINDIINSIINSYKTEARWRKAIQHLRDSGNYNGSLQDISNIIKEVQKDVKKECEDEIKDVLFSYYWGSVIERAIVRGLPEWYKEELLKASFDK